MIPPLGLERIHNGWQGIFRTALLELMPARQLGEHFHPTLGRPTKELYSVAGLLFLQEFQNWTTPETVEAYLFRTDIQFALNLEPGCDQMCERTFERYRALFLEDEGAGQIMQDVTDRLVNLLELDIRKQRLDSTHVFSNMASFGRTRLLAVTIKRFLTHVKRHHLADFEALPTAVESDANALAPVLADLQKRDLLPEEMLVDTAYGSDENVQQAAALDVEVVSRRRARRRFTWRRRIARPVHSGSNARSSRGRRRAR